MLVNRSVLCNCGIEVENNFLLESLATCHDVESKLVMYFMVNTAFVNYPDNLPDSLKFQILLNRTTCKQTLPISLKSFNFGSDLLKAPVILKDFIYQFWHKKEVFDLKERHNNKNLDLANKNTIMMLSILISGIVIFVIIKLRNLKVFRGYLFSNKFKIILFISGAWYYVPIKLCRMAGSIHVFKITRMLTLGNVKLKRNILWDVIELDWKDVNVTLNGNKINLPTSITIQFKYKFKIRCIVKKEPLLCHIMLKQGMTLFQ